MVVASVGITLVGVLVILAIICLVVWLFGFRGGRRL
jgi:hypothetical protein